MKRFHSINIHFQFEDVPDSHREERNAIKLNSILLFLQRNRYKQRKEELKETFDQFNASNGYSCNLIKPKSVTTLIVLPPIRHNSHQETEMCFTQRTKLISILLSLSEIQSLPPSRLECHR